MKAIVRQRVECSLSKYNGTPQTCQWCGVNLASIPRRTVWCSNSCFLVWRKNHIWRFARTAARRRDKYACTICFQGKHHGIAIEVNHIIPLRGRGYTYGCVHHLDNLETLCKQHHQEKTNQQRRENSPEK